MPYALRPFYRGQMKLHFPKSIPPNGFSITEVIVTMAILAVVLTGVVGAFISNLQTNNRTELRGVAVAVAQEKLEELRRRDPRTLLAGTDNGTIQASDGRTFQVETRICSDSSRCPGSARQIVVLVSYQNRLVYTVETVFTVLQETQGAGTP